MSKYAVIELRGIFPSEAATRIFSYVLNVVGHVCTITHFDTQEEAAKYLDTDPQR